MKGDMKKWICTLYVWLEDLFRHQSLEVNETDQWVKTCGANPCCLSSIPEIYKVRGENPLPQVFFQRPHMHSHKTNKC